MDGKTQVAGWIEAARDRGSAPLLLALLDAFEPLAPALAQSLLVAQPLANLWRGADGFGALANLLEEPEGIRELRRQLADDPAE
jgi:hypothetical protein